MRFKLKIIGYLIYLKVNKWLYRNDYLTLQKMRWKKQIKNLKKSKFYLPWINKGSELTSLPIVNKQIFMDHFDTINTLNINKIDALKIAIDAENSRDFTLTIKGVTVGLSTGTSGNRGCFLVSENERALWVACIIDRVIGFSISKRKVAFFMRANSNLYQSVQSNLLEFHFLDILKSIEINLDELQQIKPNIIVAQPSQLVIIAKNIENKKINISPQKVISIAEVLTSEDKEYLEKSFGQIIHQVYQCTEGFLAASCSNGTLHFNEDLLIIEKKYLDKEQTKFYPIITDLMRKSQPIIRYELNDIVTIRSSCPCGSKMLAIEQIEGRSDDILVFNSENDVVEIFPDAFRRAIVLADEQITDFALHQQNKNALGLYINSLNKSSYEKAEIGVRNLLSSHHLADIIIYRINEDPHIIGTKKRRIKNDTRKTY
jgi:putative adenylate-forming enzyme